MTPDQLFPFANHLWQTTLFAAAIALLTLLFRKNRAHVRYCLWLAASVKFLIPFSLLVDTGNLLGRRTVIASASSIPLPPVSFPSTIGQVGAPFAAQVIHTSYSGVIVPVFIAIWAIGFAILVWRWTNRWRQARASVRTALPLNLPIGLPVRSSASFGEPGVFGIIQPALLLPDGISEHLSAQEMEAILAHELCHVRRRDNLATALHMAVEALFWFHPLVWWLGARLMEERERACDEEVVREGNEPNTYAEAILKICELYLESPLQCISGITGADLGERIDRIVANRVAIGLSRARAALLASAAALAFAIPVVIGFIHAPVLIAESPAAPSAPRVSANVAKFRSVSIKPCRPQFAPTRSAFVASPPGTLNSNCATLYTFINTAYALSENLPSDAARPFISGGPTWVSSDFYRIEATAIGTPNEATMRGPMLRALLESRFGLTIHRQTKQVTMYTLNVAPGGTKLQAVPEGDCAPVHALGVMPPPPPPPPPPPGAKAATPPGVAMMPASNCGAFSGRSNTGPAELRATQFTANGVSMGAIAQQLGSAIGHPVMDKTGLSGRFSFQVKFANEESVAGPLSPASVFVVLEKQLGLKLEPTTGSREFIYIDGAERPRLE